MALHEAKNMNTMPSFEKSPASFSFLNSLQKESYHRDGYLVLPQFINETICRLLIDRANMLIANFDASSIKVIFSTQDRRHTKNQYFLESGDKIHFFLEENAVNAQGELNTDKLYSINKIGHALHDVDPVFNCFSRMHKIACLIHDLAIADPLLVQSMYICKQPFMGGEVNCHQDNTFLYVKEQPITGLWFALEDANRENGCLWAIPGGHRIPLKSRMLRDKHHQICYETYDHTPWPLEEMVPLEVSRGSAIVLHGLLPHMSKQNLSSRSRHAYTLHVMSGQHEYAAENWLQRPADMPFRGFW
ncbi:phytanoyl-CoA dioxygenase family protein [Aquicella lusitana]|uniref:Phytanoyl-CoA hydroxylase n=1 Tax=Aquicella lusitana TaxID=254246 RepID=A0A370GXG0_9COXI|nr:phytanoyl-CoA dioxygenase family protein [Aquicella lusitana]RDI46573.1 phytanoyl-CoA hydroxylase [Aquicella lusitana]VVC74237.1 hypothetical protein AQULUS_20020 [Aquicella lusitana]